MLALGAACGPRAQPPRRDSAAARAARLYPHATDRLDRLLRRQLTDPDPLSVQQMISCEEIRVAKVLGEDEGVRRIDIVLKTADTSEADFAARQRVQRALVGHATSYGGRACDSLNAIADREDPLVP